MKVIVLSQVLNEQHRKMLSDTAAEIGAELCFAMREDAIPEAFRDAEVLYGFGVNTARTSKNLRWLSVPSAGVDFLMKPGAFANEDCILTNSSGAYGVTIAEHIIAVSLMMMRCLADVSEESRLGRWGRPGPQSSLKDSRITVLGTGDIGRCFPRALSWSMWGAAPRLMRTRSQTALMPVSSAGRRLMCSVQSRFPGRAACGT